MASREAWTIALRVARGCLPSEDDGHPWMTAATAQVNATLEAKGHRPLTARERRALLRTVMNEARIADGTYIGPAVDPR